MEEDRVRERDIRPQTKMRPEPGTERNAENVPEPRAERNAEDVPEPGTERSAENVPEPGTERNAEDGQGRKPTVFRKIMEESFSIGMIIAGALLASFSVVCILLPNDAIDYGTAGIAIIINRLTGFHLSLCVAVIFLPFLIAGTFMLGKRFGFKAFIGSFFYTVGLAVFERIPFELNTEHFLAVVFGGAILGAGLAIILKNGGCIDGSEIFANILSKLIYEKSGRNLSLTYILMGFNACVYLAVFFLINRNAALLSLLVYVVATSIINHFTDHFEAIKQITIITKHPEEIIKAIRDEMHKTCTVIDSYGAIAGDNKTLICYVNYFEVQKVREIIGRSRGTFSTVSTIEEIIH